MSTQENAVKVAAGKGFMLRWTVPAGVQVTTTVMRGGSPIDLAGSDSQGGSATIGKVTISVRRDGQDVDFDGSDPASTISGSDQVFTSRIEKATAGRSVYTVKADSPGAKTWVQTAEVARQQSARIVPASFSGKGNVVAFIERLDESALPADLGFITFAGVKVDLKIESPDGRLYFTPPAGLRGEVSQAFLPSGDSLDFDSAATYTNDQRSCVQALREQLGVLCELAKSTVASDRKRSFSAAVVNARYAATLGMGHLRLGDALEALHADESSPGAGTDEEWNVLASEHASQLEAMGASLFPEG